MTTTALFNGFSRSGENAQYVSYGSGAQEQALVVIGASAGGIDALERVIGALPANLPAPVVVAQHLDPSHASLLDAILRRRTALKVVLISDSVALSPGSVYVVPAGRHVEIKDGDILSIPRQNMSGPVPSIDLLFKTAAASYGDRAVGVILSGTGSDGPSGVLAIKEAGGTIVVQDPSTATYPGLPSSIPPNLIDLMVGVDSIGGLLATVVADASVRNVDDDVLHAFLMQLRLRSGIDCTQYKSPTIRRRLSRLMAAARCKSLPDYLRYLTANPEAYQRLVSSFLIKVTGFFRDPALYRSLREEILPEIIEHSRKTKTEIRIWSAGCATGEEAYSVAILFADILGDQLDELDIRIFATDLDADSIAFARRGTYPPAALCRISPDMLQKYFTHVDDAYQIKKRIRSLIVFGEYDLGQRAPFPRIDLVLCRNVLIYFTKDLQQRTLQLFAFSLREGGYLVLGKSETTSPLPQYFANVHPMLKIFRRQGERLMFAAPAFAGNTATPSRSNRRNPQRTPVIPRRSETSMRWSLSERLGSFLFDSPTGLVVVDRNYDIQTMNQSARQMLRIHGQGIGEDLIHLASDAPQQDLKGAIDDAFRKQKPVPREIAVTDTALDETAFLQLTCYPDSGGVSDAPIQSVIIVLQDTTKDAKRRRELETEAVRIREELPHLTKQIQELLERQRSLVEANNELATANNELRSANDHLLIAAEEAEASAEEVETLNEEMQATSEELETLNEELQATVEELNTTNEELGARGHELEKLASERQEQLRESQRLRTLFEGVVEKAPFPAAVVDGGNVIVKASELYTRYAVASEGVLPKVGNVWKDSVSEVRLATDGHEVIFEVATVNLDAQDQRAKLITLLRR
jgi:two-component system CheB/CheR fusion protein